MCMALRASAPQLTLPKHQPVAHPRLGERPVFLCVQLWRVGQTKEDIEGVQGGAWVAGVVVCAACHLFVAAI